MITHCQQGVLPLIFINFNTVQVHFKIIVYDLKTAYVGSTNLTGDGLGMKGENTRNFEAGVLSSDKEFVKNAAEQFDFNLEHLRSRITR